MPGDLAGLNPAIAASGAEGDPAAAGSDIEKFKQEAIAAASPAKEDRIKGFQRVVGTKDSEIQALRSQLEEARLSSLPDDEREVEVQRRTSSELDRLRAENELLKLMPEYPSELPIFQRLLAAPDAKTQLELLREISKGASANQAPSSASVETVVADVDPNNPASSLPAGATFEGGAMTDEYAERLLRSVPRLR